MKQRKWVIVGFVAWWTAIAVTSVDERRLTAELAGMQLDWPSAFLLDWFGWLVWVPISLGLLALVDRFALERRKWATSIVVLTAGVVSANLVRAIFIYYYNDLVPFWYPETPSFLAVLKDSASSNTSTAYLMIGVAHGIHYFEKTQNSRLQIAELESGLLRARLDALSAQLNPHFLFNALNSIAEMVHKNPAKADKMIISLSLLLRQSLHRDTQHEVTVRNELELLNHYLEIERVRLDERLSVEVEVEPTCLDELIPALLLQLLVENGIVHGISKRTEPGRIAIEISKSERRLHIRVSSDTALEQAESEGHGIGLANARARLNYLYSGDFGFEVDSANRFVVNIELPAGRPATHKVQNQNHGLAAT